MQLQKEKKNRNHCWFLSFF